MPIRVVSKRSDGTKPDPGELVIDIDRGTVLGNPFVMRSESERDSVCERYAEWAVNQYANNKRFAQEINRIHELHKQGKYIALRCWCAPKRCHGDFLAQEIMDMNIRQKPPRSTTMSLDEF